MWEQEKIHLATFEQLLTMYRVRPTVFLPLWDILGYSLGYATATMGKESAMACTVAVEESITEHYNDQIRELLIRDPEESDLEYLGIRTSVQFWKTPRWLILKEFKLVKLMTLDIMGRRPLPVRDHLVSIKDGP